MPVAAFRVSHQWGDGSTSSTPSYGPQASAAVPTREAAPSRQLCRRWLREKYHTVGNRLLAACTEGGVGHVTDHIPRVTALPGGGDSHSTKPAGEETPR